MRTSIIFSIVACCAAVKSVAAKGLSAPERREIEYDLYSRALDDELWARSDLLFARQDRLPKPQNRNPPQRATAADFGVQGTSVHGRTHKRELADEYIYARNLGWDDLETREEHDWDLLARNNHGVASGLYHVHKGTGLPRPKTPREFIEYDVL
ncbi:hypothetical protein C8Q72DRAFT_887256 [Fomitopsis betulina]|nr:hypothetical protein C8Q72DRAFT_887256 [Fomitopsis betulina]